MGDTLAVLSNLCLNTHSYFMVKRKCTGTVHVTHMQTLSWTLVTEGPMET